MLNGILFGFREKCIMNENYLFSKTYKIPASDPRTNGADQSKINFKAEICRVLWIVYSHRSRLRYIFLNLNTANYVHHKLNANNDNSVTECSFDNWFDKKERETSGILLNHISDHQLLFTYIEKLSYIERVPKYIDVEKAHTISIAKFVKELNMGIYMISYLSQ